MKAQGKAWNSYYMVELPPWRVSVMWQENYSHILPVFHWPVCILPFLACIKGDLMKGWGSASAIYKRKARQRYSAKKICRLVCFSRVTRLCEFIVIYVFLSFHSFVVRTHAASIRCCMILSQVCIFLGCRNFKRSYSLPSQ